MLPRQASYAALDPGFLSHLADRGLLGGFAEFDVSFRQRPQHPAAPVDPADQRRHVAAQRIVQAVDHQSAGRRLVYGAQPVW